MDSITLDTIALACRIGCLPGEHDGLQTLQLSITLYTSTARAGESDKLHDTVDYRFIIPLIKQLESGSFHLIEHVAEIVAAKCLEHRLVENVTVHITKQPRDLGGIRATATIHRQQKNSH